ncbi:MAG: hypothetical protein CMG61_02915, partial [Candidatus Marinimicrobia bacterium]|nr:hypothetical protein [Candidatus Neomarinimicrobiota bacterium]
MINCNNSIFKKSFLTLLFFMSFIFADPTDGCELETNQVYLTASGDVLYNSDTDIAGFQFSVEGTTASGAAGGSAADAGFTVSAGGSTILGFSFTGALIPAGCGTLTSLTLDGAATGLGSLVFSDASAAEINFSYWVDSGSGGGDDVVADGCDLPINNVFLLEGDVLYNSDTDIAGFQFSVEGTTASGAAGGDAAAAGFT